MDNADPTSLQTVNRQDLSSQTEVSATLGYAGSYSVVNQAQGSPAGSGSGPMMQLSTWELGMESRPVLLEMRT